MSLIESTKDTSFQRQTPFCSSWRYSGCRRRRRQLNPTRELICNYVGGAKSDIRRVGCGNFHSFCIRA